MSLSKIVFADPNPAVSAAAVRQLTASGYDVQQVFDANAAIKHLRACVSDLIVLDFDLPDVLGLDLLREIKNDPEFGPVRVLMTSSRGREDVVAALESGADDYISKPYSLSELQARVTTALRRPAIRKRDAKNESAGVIRVDNVQHQAYVNDDAIALSPLEYSLLEFFVNHRDRMFSRAELLTHVWKNAEGVSERTVDVNVRRLRSRLAPFERERSIQTVRGSGYRFSPGIKGHVRTDCSARNKLK